MSRVFNTNQGHVSTVNGQAGAVQIGGRNMVLKSGVAVSNGAYRLARYNLSEYAADLQDGDTVSVSIKGSLAEGRYITLFASTGGYNSLGSSIRASDFDAFGVARKAYAWNRHSTPDHADNSGISIYAYPNDGDTSKVSTIEWIKLERGNVATDWTPAPEDFETRLAAIEAKLGITADLPMVDGPDMEEDMDMDEIRQAGGYDALIIVGLLPALIGGVRHG